MNIDGVHKKQQFSVGTGNDTVFIRTGVHLYPRYAAGLEKLTSLFELQAAAGCKALDFSCKRNKIGLNKIHIGNTISNVTSPVGP